MAVLVVGNPSHFDKPLYTFGSVTTIDIPAYAPGIAPTKSVAVSNPEGKALLAKVVQSLGGEEKLGSVRAVRTKAVVHAKTPQGESNIGRDRIKVYPDRVWIKLGTPSGDMAIVTTPRVAFATGPQGTRDLPASQKEGRMKEMRRDPISVAQHANDPEYTFTASGTAKVADVDTSVLVVNVKGDEFRWFIDPQTGRVLRESSHVVSSQGPAEEVLDLSEWKDFGGILFATKVRITRNGQDGGSVDLKEVEINPTVDPKIFERPQ